MNSVHGASANLTSRGPAVGAARGAKKRGSWFRPLPWAGVKWSLGYASFLVFVFVITTFRLPIGMVAMIATVIGLAISGLRLRMPAPMWWMVGFGLWAAVGLESTLYPGPVQLALEDFGKVLVIAFAAMNLIRTRPQFRLFMFVFLGSFAFYPVRGALFNYFLYGSSMAGRAVWNDVYANPNDLAAYCLPQLGFAVGLLYMERSRAMRLAALAGALLLPFVMLLTQSRGGFLGLLVFLICLLSNQRRRLRTALLVGVGGLVVGVAAPDSVWKRFSGLTKATNTEDLAEVDSEGSALQRYEIWKVARAIIADHPATGVGLGAYPYAHFTYAQSPRFLKTAQGYRDTHNTYLRVMAETGAVGLVIFITIIGTTFYHAERVRRRAPPALRRQGMQLFFTEVGFLAYLVAGIFGSFGTISFTYLYLALIYSCAELLRRDIRAHRLAARSTPALPRLPADRQSPVIRPAIG